MNDLSKILSIAQEAGAILSTYFYSGFSQKVTIKSDQTPVTAADMAVDLLIREQLTKIDPTIPILSEESDVPDFSIRQQWSRYWLIDPLDGTRGFIRKSPEFSVNIALIENHQPILGVVYSPIEKFCYYATKNLGAFFLDAEKRVKKIHVSLQNPKELRFLCGYYDHSICNQALLKTAFEHVTIKQMNSALKFPYLAQGLSDVYVRFGRTCEWDTAAGQCVLSEAGGAVVDFLGQPLQYNAKSSLINPAFIAMGDVSQLEKYLSVFSKIQSSTD